MSPLARSQPIRWDQQCTALLIAGRTIAFTPTEYRLCALFAMGRPVTYAELADGAYSCQLDRNVRVMLDKHIDRIRGKLHGSGICIYCILGYGYILLPEQEDDAPST